MPRTKPPFRADMVGSLLRPAVLKEARARRAAGDITPEALRAVEDAEIGKILKKQEEIGLQSVTDGEFRRSWWHLDFLEGLEGVEGYQAAHGIAFQGGETKPRAVRAAGKIRFNGHPFIDHYKFVRANTKKTAKMTIPSPSVLYHRGGRAAINPAVYPDLPEFFHDLGETYKATVTAFGQAGCSSWTR